MKWLHIMKLRKMRTERERTHLHRSKMKKNYHALNLTCAAFLVIMRVYSCAWDRKNARELCGCERKKEGKGGE